MPPSVHSPSPDHARHVHEEPLQSGAGSLQPKLINKRPLITSTIAGATAPTTTGVESRRPSSLPRTPQSVTPPSSTELVGPVVMRRRKVGSAQASSERPLVQRKKRSVPGNNVVAGRPSTESETTTTTTTTTPSLTTQGTADNISGVVGVGANQMSTMGMYGSPYGLGMSPYGGMGIYSGMGMYGGGMMMGGAGPFSGLNNFLFGFQSVVFSLGQAMQVCFFLLLFDDTFLFISCFRDKHSLTHMHLYNLTTTTTHTHTIFMRKDTGNEYSCAAAAISHGHVLF